MRNNSVISNYNLKVELLNKINQHLYAVKVLSDSDESRLNVCITSIDLLLELLSRDYELELALLNVKTSGNNEELTKAINDLVG